jgi:predicted oxidoreductase
MKRAILTPQGPEFSQLIYGTWRSLDTPGADTPAHLLERLKTCLDLGITTIDTAEIYGLYHVEELIGRALRQDPGVKDRVEIVTKCGIYVPCEFHPERKTAFYNATADRIIKSTEKSLRFLGVDTIDLLLVHRPDWLASIDDTAAGLNRLVRDGKVRAVGVSNYSASQFEALASRMETPLATNQVEFNFLHMDPIDDGVFDQCQRLRTRPMAWSPLAGGSLARPDSSPAAARLHELAANLGKKYGGASFDQLAFAWILAHPSGPLPVIGTNQVERIRSAAGSTAIQLEREDWYALWAAAKGHGIP